MEIIAFTFLSILQLQINNSCRIFGDPFVNYVMCRVRHECSSEQQSWLVWEAGFGVLAPGKPQRLAFLIF